jgi:Family of unknown function (DUF6084)
MVELDFAMQDVKVEDHAMSPTLLFMLRVTNNTPDLAVRNVMLNCQIRIESTRRNYSPPEHDRLSDLFGEPERWGQTLNSFLWTHGSLAVPAFEGECVATLPVPCSYDFNVAATKYFYGLENGDVPLNLLFSGSVFYRDVEGQLQIGQISWTKESAYRLPVAVWRNMMERYYPQCNWLCLRREAFEQLYRYKRQKGLPSFEHALHDLLDAKTVSVAP